jgi:hypothetical protein
LKAVFQHKNNILSISEELFVASKAGGQFGGLSLVRKFGIRVSGWLMAFRPTAGQGASRSDFFP